MIRVALFAFALFACGRTDEIVPIAPPSSATPVTSASAPSSATPAPSSSAAPSSR